MFQIKSIHTLLPLVFISLFVTGCQEKTDPNGEPVASAEIEENEKDTQGDIPVAATDIEGMLAQQPGKLVQAHMDPEIEAARTVNFTQYMNYYDKTFTEVMEKELPSYFQEQKDLDSDQIYDYLVYQLGSGQYQAYYDQLLAIEHGFEMPELPEGQDEIEMVKRSKTNVVILMDASGSMKAELAGVSRMKLAKEAIEKFTEELDDEVHVSLLAYGHKGTGNQSDQQLSCTTIDAVYPLSPYNQTDFQGALNSFQASGWTPLAGAIEEANKILEPYGNGEYRNIVYIVSDGIETCGGDPVAAAKQLNESNIEAKVNIIGFDVDDEGQNQLKQVAEAGGGKYATVRDPSEFEEVLLKKWKPSIFQVIGQQGVKLHESVHFKEDLINTYSLLTNLSDRESIRISDAAYLLKRSELISEENAQRVIDRSKEMKELRNTHFKEIVEQKEEEADAAEKEIDQKVNEWKEKWRNELEKD
ncbi:VWA domain-containing protein [Sporosarcina sp. 179-K 3D1 HS]|uniref:vWA domain-containing protein n=1 Tax=Sporosarcina sp. 179-K 3D1 HS TaxID=3232169 RepID=UPI0039A088EB